MPLPKIKFTRAQGQLNRTRPTADHVLALVLSGAAVAGKIELNDPKMLTSINDLTTLGITAANNPLAFEEVTNFYAKANAGVRLWLTLYSDATMMADVCDKDTGAVRKLLLAAGGAITAVYLNKITPAGYVPVMVDGLDADVWNAAEKLQATCQLFADGNMPIYGVLPALGFDIDNLAALRDLNTMTDDSVAIVAGADNAAGKPAIGTLAGWVAAHEVHQNIGWVGMGAVLENAWLGAGVKADDPEIQSKLDTLHDLRYIFFRKIPGKSGYFFNDDPTATSISSDYSSISWNAVINKAQRLAYDSLVDHLNEEVDVDATTGRISPVLAADWEGDVERAILNEMRRKNQISGVRCSIDIERSDPAADQIAASVQIVRKGQAKNFNVEIGYTPALT